MRRHTTMLPTTVLVALLLLFCALLASAGLASPAWAAELQVSNTNDSGVGSFRQAITDATPGDTINFNLPEGSTITLTGSQLAINKNLTIKGPDARSLAVSGNNQSRVFSVGAGSSVAISGLTIEGGRAVGAGATGRNGRSNTPGDPGQGGAIYNAGTLDLSGVAVSGNAATGGRGGNGATTNNGELSAPGAAGGPGQGGGIYNAGTLSISKSTFGANQATGGAGGTGDGAPDGTGGSGQGGAILNAGTLSVSGSTLDANQATGGAGGTGGTGEGGGLSNLSGTTTSAGVTVSGNQAAGGAGSSGSNGAGKGGGLFNKSGSSFGTGNTIVALNTASGGSSTTGPDVSGAFTSNGYNLIGKGDGGSGFGTTGDQGGTEAAPLDPKLSPLQDNGGPTDTRALQDGSPAIDKGKSLGLTDDQRGEARPQDDPRIANASGGDGSDIGAFELEVALSDTTAPTVESVTPAANAKAVPRATLIEAEFSEEMTEATLNSSNVKLSYYNKKKRKWVPVTATVGCKVLQEGTKTCKTVTLRPDTADPANRLMAGKKHKVTITAGVEDRAGNALDQNPTTSGNQSKVWTFTTGSS